MTRPPELWIPRADRRIPCDRPLIMGILNLNDDSFCGDGTLDYPIARDMVRSMLANGADIIDVGAESARTNRAAISADAEIARLLPFITEFTALAGEAEPPGDHQIWPPLLSINTWRPEVVDAVLPLAGDLLNDMGGLPDDRNARACARAGAALLIMHTVGEPKVPHTHCAWPDIRASLAAFFTAKIALATAAGVDPQSLVLDPGIDFAKQKSANLRILAHAGDLAIHGCPVLLPISRKTMIGEVLGLDDPLDRDAGTLACLVAGMLRVPGPIFRVHNVAAAARAARVIAACR